MTMTPMPAPGSAEESALLDRYAAETALRADEHRDHPWEMEGRCFYCVPCDVRVGQGTLIARASRQGRLPWLRIEYV